MLRKVDFLNHKTNTLLKYFENYLQSIKNLPVGTSFVEAHCPDNQIRKYIKSDNAGKANELKKKFIAFQKSFLDLVANDRSTFLKIFKESNGIDWLLKNPEKATRIGGYPGDTGKWCHDLLVYLFSNTIKNDEYDVKGHYKEFYDSLTNRWCPFCGMEYYKVPERQKEDYDHLLCKKEYPAAAINMRNLIAMGEGCNRRYKKGDDVLTCLGKATKIVNPFLENIEPSLNLKGSKLHSSDSKCKWVVNVSPKTDKVKAWNKIFKIDERIKEEYLVKRPNSKQDPEFRNIIYTYVQTLRSARKVGGRQWTWVEVDLMFRDHIDLLKSQYFRDSCMFKAALFELILDEADNTYQQALLSMINN